MNNLTRMHYQCTHALRLRRFRFFNDISLGTLNFGKRVVVINRYQDHQYRIPYPKNSINVEDKYQKINRVIKIFSNSISRRLKVISDNCLNFMINDMQKELPIILLFRVFT